MYQEACVQEGRISGLEHDMDNMKGWQKSQNGSIVRVEGKVDKLIFFQLSTVVGMLVSIGLTVFGLILK